MPITGDLADITCWLCIGGAGSWRGDVYLREDAVSGMSYLENQCELRAPTADVAARLLDAAIATRTVPCEY